jgi:hypothetical protein
VRVPLKADREISFQFLAPFNLTYSRNLASSAFVQRPLARSFLGADAAVDTGGREIGKVEEELEEEEEAAAKEEEDAGEEVRGGAFLPRAAGVVSAVHARLASSASAGDGEEQSSANSRTRFAP